MQGHQQERQIAEQTASTDERLLAAFEEIEILREQLESLNLELRYKEQQLQEAEQELKLTNLELCTALSKESKAQPTRDSALKLALKILESEKPVRECLASLLSAIYGETVHPWELRPRLMPQRARLSTHPTTRERKTC
jgi:chromosome segregation ATPase